MSIQQPILLLGAEKVAASEADLLPKLNSILLELIERKGKKVDRKSPFIEIDNNGCWIWLRYVNESGYGMLTFNYSGIRTHRFFYEKFYGKIKEGMHSDHLCRNTACCNPHHIEIVTPKENIRRGIGIGAENSRKTHCPKGHKYDEINTTYNNKGWRRCRACANARRNKYIEKMKTNRVVGSVYFDVGKDRPKAKFDIRFSDLTVEAQALILAGEAAKEKETDETLDRR